MTRSIPFTSLKQQALTSIEENGFGIHERSYAGFLTDYYATPSIKTYMAPMVAVIDLEHDTAAIPGSGHTPVAFIHTFDLAKYVDAALDLEKWEPEYYVIGDKLTWNEFVKHVEAARGIPSICCDICAVANDSANSRPNRDEV